MDEEEREGNKGHNKESVLLGLNPKDESAQDSTQRLRGEARIPSRLQLVWVPGNPRAIARPRR